jgi:hypothetical protein
MGRTARLLQKLKIDKGSKTPTDKDPQVKARLPMQIKQHKLTILFYQNFKILGS